MIPLSVRPNQSTKEVLVLPSGEIGLGDFMNVS